MDATKVKTACIITSSNPDAEKASGSENEILNTEFKKLLSFKINPDEKREIIAHRIGSNEYKVEPSFENNLAQTKYPYYKVKGKYGSVKDSFLVYNITISNAADLAKLYKQQSFIFITNEEDKLVFDFYANKSKSSYSYKKIDTRSLFKNVTNAEDHYTQICRDFKINIPFETFEVASNELEEVLKEATEEEILHTMDEKFTGFRQYGIRSTVYSKYFSK